MTPIVPAGLTSSRLGVTSDDSPLSKARYLQPWPPTKTRERRPPEAEERGRVTYTAALKLPGSIIAPGTAAQLPDSCTAPGQLHSSWTAALLPDSCTAPGDLHSSRTTAQLRTASQLPDSCTAPGPLHSSRTAACPGGELNKSPGPAGRILRRGAGLSDYAQTEGKARGVAVIVWTVKLYNSLFQDCQIMVENV